MKKQYKAYSIYIISIIITFLFPCIGFCFIFYFVITNSNKTLNTNDKYFAIAIALLFAAFGYSITHSVRTEDDLTRYFEQLAHFETYYDSIFEVWNNDDMMLYTRDLLFFIVSRTKDVHLLPYIVGLGVYVIVFYVMFDVVSNSKHKYSYGDLLKLSFIILCVFSPYFVLHNVRCVFAFTLISFATYRDLIQKKRNIGTILLYIVPIGMHTAAISIIILRFLQYFVKHIGLKVLFIAILLPVIIDVLHQYLNIGGYIGHLINKAYYYLHWTEGGWADKVEKSSWYLIERFLGLSYITFIFICVHIYSENKKNMNLFHNPMIRFLFCVAACAIGSLFIKTGSFWRYTILFSYFSTIIIIQLLDSGCKKIKNIFSIFFYLSIVFIALNTYKTYKMIDFEGTVVNFMSFCGLDFFFT